GQGRSGPQAGCHPQAVLTRSTRHGESARAVLSVIRSADRRKVGAFMRGSLVHRGKDRWGLVVDLGYVVDPTTGHRKRKQVWHTFHGSKKEAGEKLNELVGEVNRDEFVDRNKWTVTEWLTHWLDKIVTPKRRPRTVRTYRSVIEGTLIPELG